MLPHDRRSATRIESGHLVIHAEADAESMSQCLGMGVTLDINEFGLRMQSRESFDVGTRYIFSIALEDEVIQAAGRIVHTALALNDTFENGVEFLEIGAAEIEKIRAFVARRTPS